MSGDHAQHRSHAYGDGDEITPVTLELRQHLVELLFVPGVLDLDKPEVLASAWRAQGDGEE